MRIINILFFAGIAFMLSCTREVPDIDNSGIVLSFANAIDTARVFPWVEQLTEVHLNDTPISNEGYPPEELFPSDHLTRSAAVGFIAKAFDDMGYSVDTVALGSEPHVAYNVVAELKGTTKPNEVVLVAGHLDAFYGGADDNTTAIAAMFEIAHAARNFQFERTIRFVAFDLEELGSVGSTRYIEAGYANDVVSAVVMDLIGYSSDKPGSQKDVMGVKLPNVGDFISVIGNANSSEITQKIVNLSHTSKIAKTVGVIAPNNGTYFLSSVFMRSDHGLLWYKGLPAIFFTDGANFRNANYHQSTDLPQTINRNFLNNNTKLIAATVAILADIQP